MSDWLEHVQAGDVVAVESGWGHRDYALTTVDRVTATQIIVGPRLQSRRFRRADGKLIGASSWQSVRIVEPTPDLRARVARQAAIALLRVTVWEQMPDAVLAAVADQVREAKTIPNIRED